MAQFLRNISQKSDHKKHFCNERLLVLQSIVMQNGLVLSNCQIEAVTQFRQLDLIKYDSEKFDFLIYNRELHVTNARIKSIY